MKNREEKTIAAVDLGSNSFHLGIASWHNNHLEIKTRMREKIQLAAGLTEEKYLTQECQDRALACLAKFGELISNLPPQQVRIVGTNTFRVANKLAGFLEEAQRVLGHPVEIISGQEEARLIYLGVTKTRGIPPQRLLVVDIGGGSTEMVVGEKGIAEWLKSVPIGCVTFAQQFFPGSQNNAAAFEQAKQNALCALKPYKEKVAELNWQLVWGTSGTIDSVDSVLKTNGWTQGGITAPLLELLREKILGFTQTVDIQLPGLRPDRASIFPSGVAILTAVFETFGITEMETAGAALREGLLFELVEGLK